MESELQSLLKIQHEDRRRIYEAKGEVVTAFGTLYSELVQDNDLAKLKAASKMSSNQRLNIEGWNIANQKFADATVVVDRCHSVLYEVYMGSIETLGKVSEVKNISVQQPIAGVSQQIQPGGVVTEKPGLTDRLFGWVDSLKPKWKQDYEHGISLVSDLFEYLNNTRVKWEEYRAQHWQNISKAVTWDASEFTYELLEELEALDDCRMRTVFLTDIGYRMIATRHSKDMASTANAMLSVRQAQLSQPPMGFSTPMHQMPNNHR